MCKRTIDIIGHKFGNLVVRSYSHKDSASRNYYECECKCGTLKVIQQSNLLSGRSTSCGCSRLSTSTTKAVNSVESNIESAVDSKLYSFDDIGLDHLPIIKRGKFLSTESDTRFKTVNPFVLKEVILLNKGDRVVVKETKQIGFVISFVSIGKFDISLDVDSSIITVESIHDVWLLCKYNDEQKISFGRS